MAKPIAISLTQFHHREEDVATALDCDTSAVDARIAMSDGESSHAEDDGTEMVITRHGELLLYKD